MIVIYHFLFSFSTTLQTEIAKRLSALINQLLPCLQPEHQQQVVQAVDRAKQVTMPELNAIIGVSIKSLQISFSVVISFHIEFIISIKLIAFLSSTFKVSKDKKIILFLLFDINYANFNDHWTYTRYFSILLLLLFSKKKNNKN